MQISQERYDQYWRNGWLVVEEVFTREEAEAIAQLALTVSQAELATATAGYLADRADDGQLAPRKIDRPFRKEAAFRRFILDARLQSLIEQLLGAPPLLVTDQIFMKPPRFGSAKPYHQDNAHFLCSPADHVITAWVALDDVDAENGCLRYIDGSHQRGLAPHAPMPEEQHNLAPSAKFVDLDKESLAPVGKGGVVFHHGETLHTSHRNESDRWRRAYASHWVTADVTSANDTLNNAYFRSELYDSNS